VDPTTDLEWALCEPGAKCARSPTTAVPPPRDRTFWPRRVCASRGPLACGVPLESFGPRVTDPMRSPRPPARARWRAGLRMLWTASATRSPTSPRILAAAFNAPGMPCGTDR
jgi:hypothetical protein